MQSPQQRPCYKTGSPFLSPDRVNTERSRLSKEPLFLSPTRASRLLAGATLELPPLSLVVYIVIISLRDLSGQPIRTLGKRGEEELPPHLPPSPERLLGGSAKVSTDRAASQPANSGWQAIGASSAQAPPPP